MKRKRMIKAYMESNSCTTVINIIGVGSDGRKTKSNRFYITKDEMLRFFRDEYIVAKDIRNFLVMSAAQGYISFDFTWLESNGHEVHGKEEHILLEYDKFQRWFWNSLAAINAYSTKPNSFKSLEFIIDKHPRIIFKSKSQLSNILRNKIMTRKFVQFMKMHFTNTSSMCEKIVFSDDFVDYSFYFVKHYVGGSTSNGGMIFHKDHEFPNDLSKGKYGYHT